ncbi:MAG: SpoIIIAH-like family protein [Firmicutes bacterium]|nr:SpoIIIAH-like family protein [Bacillota bacterium]
MPRLIRISWRNLMLFFLALIGIIFFAIGWNGLPEEENETSPTSANVIKMPVDAPEKDNGGANYFVDSRMGRQRARGQQLETLRGIINNPASKQEIRSEAQQSIMTISENISMEMELESLIRAKGFDDSVVYLKDNNATVVVKSAALTPEEAARICDLVSRGTGMSEQNIVVIPTR